LGALTSAAKTPLPPPPPEAVPELAAQLADLLGDRTVIAPDGASVPVMVPSAAEGSEGLLDATRLEACLRTVGAAEAWPKAWLVVRVEAVAFDLILPVRLDDDGRIEDPEIVFTATRREWTVDALRDAIRSETGRKPKGRTWNVVVQGFTTRVEHRYVYEAPTERRGLLELFPEGTLLREATTVKLPGGGRYTLALVLQEAELVPSSCDDCASWMIGHADTGRILLVLVGGTEVADELDVTPLLRGSADRPLLSRYACDEGDRHPPSEEIPIALEFTLFSGVSNCEAESVLLGVDPSAPELLVIDGRR